MATKKASVSVEKSPDLEVAIQAYRDARSELVAANNALSEAQAVKAQASSRLSDARAKVEAASNALLMAAE